MNLDGNADVNARLRMFSWLAAIGGFIVLVLIAIFMTVVLILALRVQDAATTVEAQAQQSHDALCAVEQNLTNEIRRTTAFLAENPTGLTSPSGQIVIPAELIEAGLRDDREALDALRANIFCEEDV
jgi:hypothetical protein